MKIAGNSISECFPLHVFGTCIAFMRLTHLKSDRYTHLLLTSVGNDSSLARFFGTRNFPNTLLNCFAT